MPAKRKRNDDVARNIPDGTGMGFVSVRDLLVEAPKKRKTATMPKNFETCGEDDETDEDIGTGRVLAQQMQPVAASGDKPISKAKLRKSTTTDGTKPKPKRTKKKVSEPTLSQFLKQGADDSDNMDITQGAILPANKTTPETILQSSPQSSPAKPVDDSVLKLSDCEPSHLSLSKNQALPLFLKDDDQDIRWIMDDDDDNLDFEIVDSSPLVPKRALPSLERMQVGNDSIEISVPQKRRSMSSSSKTLVDDSVEFIEPVEKRTISKRKLLISSSPEIFSPPSSPLAALVTSGSTSSLCPATPLPVSSLRSPFIGIGPL
jgi:ATP-dependent DNA helicase MPH1